MPGRNRSTYAGRRADVSWTEAMRCLVEPKGKRVVDVGCGGSIYARAWHEMGADRVVGVDFSDQMPVAAGEHAVGVPRVLFQRGEAAATGLPTAAADIVFLRACPGLGGEERPFHSPQSERWRGGGVGGLQSTRVDPDGPIVERDRWTLWCAAAR